MTTKNGNKDIFIVIGDKVNFKKTIRKSVNIEELYRNDLISNKVYNELMDIYSAGEMKCWGFQDNASKNVWKQMDKNDLCLMYNKSKIVMSGIIIYKFKNQDVANYIWKSRDTPFEYIFCFKDVHILEIPSDKVLQDEFDYVESFIRGGGRLARKRLKNVIKKHGSVDKFRKNIEQKSENDLYIQNNNENDIVKENSARSVWWVNQGKTMNEEKSASILWAPIKNKNGSNEYHWETMKEVKEGDIVLHYANGTLRYVSKVTEEAKNAEKPDSLRQSTINWHQEGRLVKTDYYQLDPPIELDTFNDKIVDLDINKGPLNKNGGVNQGYLFYFTKEALKIIQEVQTDTNWPEYSIIEGDSMKTDPSFSTEEIVENIDNYIKVKGFTYTPEMIDNFYLSLKTKPFVLLAGISGTGKTKLVQLFAEAIGCTSDNGQFKLISVKPDWNDSSDLLGYSNIRGDFQAGPMIKIIKNAIENPDKPYIVCLDEMNLARVEYYFSEFLSKMETRRYSDGKIITDKLLTVEDFEKENDENKYAGLYIPQNLYIVGTVNMDETTHPFSKKVLDRANTIEFNDIELMAYQENNYNDEDIKRIAVRNDFLVNEYLSLKESLRENKGLINDITSRLTAINEILKEANLQVGYRIRDEINFYLIQASKNNIMDIDIAFDKQIMQKILPRIQGSSRRIKNILIKLFKFTTDKDYTTENGDIFEDMLKYYKNNKGDIKYPSSSEKIIYMIKRYEEDGFTAYWL